MDEVKDIIHRMMNTGVAGAGFGSSSGSYPSTPVVEEWMISVTITRYPDGRSFPKISMWQKGCRPFKKKVKKQNKKQKLMINKAVKKQDLFEV